MKNFDWKKLLPHVFAIGIFLIVAVIYCKPALEGKVLQQTDIVYWKGTAQNAFEYKKTHGQFPLWNTHVFSGMPDYQVAMESKSYLIDFGKILSLGLPKPINYFFLACVCFYILCMVLRINVVVAVLGSLAYAYSTYNPIIIAVGHETKMLAIAYMPALLAGLLLLYQKKYVVGLMVTALFASMEIGANHPQINYYFIIIAGFMTIAFVIKWIKAKEWKHLFIALGLAVLGGLIGVGNSAVALLTTAEYSKYTMRGGKTLESNGTELKQVKTTGLDVDYALSYSIAKSEFLTFLMPNAFGGSSGEGFDENSKIVSVLTGKNVPENNAIQIAAQLPKYWGGIVPSTSGPVYFGAIICLLFIVGAVIVNNEYRWWILSAVVFAILLAWGSYFLSFNKFLLKHLPLYDKFRAPSMALVIPQLLFPLMAVLCLQQLFFTENSRLLLQQNFKKILYVLGGVVGILILMYLFNDYSSANDQQIIKGFSGQTGNDEIGRAVVKGMIEERQSMFGSGIFRALIFVAITLGALYLYLKNIVKPFIIVIAFTLINTIDLFAIDSKYLNSDNYIDDESYQSGNFTPTAADVEILKDKDPHYRVENLSPDRFQEGITAYYLRCIGGYHPAKLSIYQDLIENQLSKNNMSVLNMLDTRYFIIPPQQSQSQQQQQAAVQRNDSAMGACWFVKEVKFVNGPVEEMKALDNFNPAKTAFVDNSFKSVVSPVAASDSSAKLTLTSYDNDDIKYAAASKSNQFAVFSEVYYPAGWNAYIDGKKADYCKTNYVLRGLSVPAGNHVIEFKFEPTSYYTGQTLVYIANALLWLSILASLFFWWKQQQQKTIEKV